jgi:hypothetical protein
MSMAGSRKTIECLLAHAAVLMLPSSALADCALGNDPRNPRAHEHEPANPEGRRCS